MTFFSLFHLSPPDVDLFDIFGRCFDLTLYVAQQPTISEHWTICRWVEKLFHLLCLPVVTPIPTRIPTAMRPSDLLDVFRLNLTAWFVKLENQFTAIYRLRSRSSVGAQSEISHRNENPIESQSSSISRPSVDLSFFIYIFVTFRCRTRRPPSSAERDSSPDRRGVIKKSKKLKVFWESPGFFFYDNQNRIFGIM